MKWLILSDNDDIKNRCSEYISKGNRKDKVLVAELSVASLKVNKKFFHELAACLIYANDDTNIEPALGVALSAVFGYFASEKVPVLTNMRLFVKMCFLVKKLLFLVNQLIFFTKRLLSNTTFFLMKAA